jgi:hypothetical protein
MGSLTTETRDIGDIVGLHGQLRVGRPGSRCRPLCALQVTRSHDDVAVRLLRRLLRVPAKESPLLKGRTAASGLQNQGAAVQLSYADAIRRIPPRSCSQGAALLAGWLSTMPRLGSAGMHAPESGMRCFEPSYDYKVSELLAFIRAAARITPLSRRGVQDRLRGACQNPRRRAGGDRFGTTTARISVCLARISRVEKQR